MGAYMAMYLASNTSELIGGPSSHELDDGEDDLNGMRRRGCSLPEAVREPGEAQSRAVAAAPEGQL